LASRSGADEVSGNYASLKGVSHRAALKEVGGHIEISRIGDRLRELVEFGLATRRDTHLDPSNELRERGR
jgi:hypothetical protein